MLSNNTFLEVIIQWVLDGLIFVGKGLGMQMQCMLKISKVYTLAEILNKIFVKNEGTLFTIMVLTNERFGANLTFIKINNAITACMTYTFLFENID